ncbi:MAG: hypothetical protein ABI151_15065 [Chitinophagaceae bacterium]
MIKIILPWLVLILPLSVFAQQNNDLEPASRHPLSVRVNLFGPLDILDGNFTGGIEYGISPRLSLTGDLGAIVYSAYLNNNSRALGYLFKPGLKYYFTEKRRGYVEGNIFYKRVGYKVDGWLSRGNINGVPSYEENRIFIYRKRVAGLQFLAGYKARLNKKSTVWLDSYGGLSVRMKWQDIKDLPDAVYRRDNIFFDGLRENYSIYPGFQMGLRLVFDLGIAPTL